MRVRVINIHWTSFHKQRREKREEKREKRVKRVKREERKERKKKKEKKKKKREREEKREERKEKMTDVTLTTVSLLSHERGHTGQSRVAESTCIAGHHLKSQQSCTVPICVLSVNTPPRARARLSLNTSIRNKTCVGFVTTDKHHSTSFSACPHAQSYHASSYRQIVRIP